MASYKEVHLNIKAWAEEDRPREKLLLRGAQHLSNTELLAILLRSGSRNQSAVVAAKKMLDLVEHNLHELGKCSITELKEIDGVGDAKAITILAALELGRRRQLTDIKKRPQIKSSQDAYNVLAPLLIDLSYEEFWIVLLNRANLVIGRTFISSGGMAGTVVDSKIIFQKALAGRASAIILFHNHPSGNYQPSQADIDLTRKLKKAGETLDIAVLDHLIISEQGYYSFADEGIL